MIKTVKRVCASSVFTLSLIAVAQLGLAPAAQAQTAARGLPDFADLVEAAGPAVVNIRTVEKVSMRAAHPGMPELDENDPFYEFFRRFFPSPQVARLAGRVAQALVVADPVRVVNKKCLVAWAAGLLSRQRVLF